MRTAPWIKRIELDTGDATSLALDPTEAFIPPSSENARKAHAEQFVFDGQSWFHLAKPGDRRWAIHGTVATSERALYCFMEYVEARHDELESALTRDATAIGVYADWLEEQGDPYAASLKPELLKERGPAGMWFLEGLDRTGNIQFVLRDGLLREVTIGGLAPEKLHATLHRIAHLRASLALERVIISTGPLGATVATANFWPTIRWPSSMKELVLPEGINETQLAAVQRMVPRVKLVTA